MLRGGAGQDWLNGGFGADTLIGDEGSDTLDGGAGDDAIWGIEGGAPETDFLNGGTGNDSLFIGAGDYASGGEGSDSFVLGDWAGNEDLSRITDFNPDDDEIVVLYDPAEHPDPMVTLLTEDGSADATVMLDGLPLAHISGGAGLDPGMVRLVQATR